MNLQVISTGSKGNCYLLNAQAGQLVIEAGGPLQRLMKHIQPLDIAGLVVSHSHQDHAAQAYSYLTQLTDCPRQHAIDLNNQGSFVYPPNPKGFQVRTFDLHHDVQNKGFLITTQGLAMAYVSDTSYMPVRLHSLSHLLIECNYSEYVLGLQEEQGAIQPWLANRIRNSHLSVEELRHYVSLIDKDQLQKIVLCHVSEERGDPDNFQNQIAEASGVPVEVAENNKTILL